MSRSGPFAALGLLLLVGTAPAGWFPPALFAPADEALPPGAIGRLGSERFWLPGAVLAADFSPDGKRLAAVRDTFTGVPRFTLDLWDTTSGRLTRSIPVPQADYGRAFSPDGTMLALVRFDDVRVHRLATGEFFWSIPRHGDEHFGPAAFSPDGKLLALPAGRWPDALTWKGRLRLLDVPGGAERDLGKFLKPVTALAFAPDGRTLYTGDHDNELVAWDLATGKDLWRGPLPAGGIWHLALSPDGRAVAVQSRRELYFRDAATGKALGQATYWRDRYQGNSFAACAMAFTPDGKKFRFVDTFGGLREYDPATGKQLGEHPGRPTPPRAVAISPDAATVAVGHMQLLTLSDAATGRERTSSGHEAPVTALAATPDGRTLLSAGEDRTFRVWDVPTRRELRCWRPDWEPPPNRQPRGALAPDGRAVAMCVREAVVVADPVEGKDLCRVPCRTEVAALAFAPDGKSLAVLEWGELRVVDRATGKAIWQETFEGGAAGAPSAVTFAPDGSTVAVAFAFNRRPSALAARRNRGFGVALFDAASGKELRWLPAESPGVRSAAFTPDGRSVVGHSEAPNGGMLVWDARTGEVRSRGRIDLVPDPKATYVEESADCALSPDGRLLATFTVNDHFVRLWEVASGSEVARFAVPADQPPNARAGAVRALAFLTDGRTVATAGGTTVLLWDAYRSPFAKGWLPAGPLPAEELRAEWDRLAGEPRAAFEAAARLLTGPRPAVALIADRLAPAPPADSDAVARFIADLDGPRFAAREEATRKLAELGGLATPALQKALAAKPSAEAQRRIERLLATADRAEATTAGLRAFRAVHLLELIGDAEARRHLRKLADGAGGAAVTRAAAEALGRLAKQD